tara:strand:- start:1018 stop:1191 length:174 start_codon:yes stop_codon:yes gene_type:complete
VRINPINAIKAKSENPINYFKEKEISLDAAYFLVFSYLLNIAFPSFLLFDRFDQFFL